MLRQVPCQHHAQSNQIQTHLKFPVRWYEAVRYSLIPVPPAHCPHSTLWTAHIFQQPTAVPAGFWSPQDLPEPRRYRRYLQTQKNGTQGWYELQPETQEQLQGTSTLRKNRLIASINRYIISNTWWLFRVLRKSCSGWTVTVPLLRISRVRQLVCSYNLCYDWRSVACHNGRFDKARDTDNLAAQYSGPSRPSVMAPSLSMVRGVSPIQWAAIVHIWIYWLIIQL